MVENLQKVFRDPGFPLLESRDFKAKSGGDSGLKVSLEVHASNVANDE